MHLKLILVIAITCCADVSLGQEFAQRFSIADILESDSDLNAVLTNNVRKMIMSKSTDLIAFRFGPNVQNGTLIWIRSEKEASSNPFEQNAVAPKNYEFVIAPIYSISKIDNLSWQPLQDLSVLQNSVLCSLSENPQEINLTKMKALHDERCLFLFVKHRGKFIGGKILNPKPDSQTCKLLTQFDNIISKAQANHPAPSIPAPHDSGTDKPHSPE